MKFIESYRNILTSARLFSKATSFLMAIFLMLEIFSSFYLYYFRAERNWLNDYWNNILVSLGFQTFISLTFLLRFALLNFKNCKFVWFAQFTWLLSWSSIIFYQLITSRILFGSFYGKREFSCVDCFYFDTFLWASDKLTVILIAYQFLSPIKQLLLFVSALTIPKSMVESQQSI